MSRVPGARRRWWLWLPLLAGSAWLALFGDKSVEGNAAALVVAPAPAAPAKAPTSTTAAPGPETLELLASRAAPAQPAASGADAPRRDLFSTRNWNPPPPPPPRQEPAAPVAPPLPFGFLGKKLDGGAWEIYLTRGEQTFIVREGETLEGTYRIDKIAPPSMALTYLPLGQVQTLSIGDTR